MVRSTRPQWRLTTPSWEGALKYGLMMEVLSWKMLSEEPTAASLISQALNTAQNVALRTSELTALKVLSGAVALECDAAIASDVCFESVREKVRAELDLYVDMAEFIDLFEFIINMGASKDIHSAVAGVWEQVRRPKTASAEPSGVC